MTQDEKLERLRIIIGIKTKMQRSILYYLIASIGLFLSFAVQSYPDFLSYLPIGIFTLAYIGFIGYLYNDARVSLNETYQKYKKVEAGDPNADY